MILATRFLVALPLVLISAMGVALAERSVMDYGAKPDGSTDNTAAFQTALDAASVAKGGVVTVPAGHYRFTGTLTIPSSVTLKGTFRSAPYVSKDEIDKNTITGSVLLPTAGRNKPDGTPFITLNTNSTIEGLIIHYPDWKVTDVPPVPYPPCISSAPDTYSVCIKHTNIVDAYYAIRMRKSSRFLISDVQGYPSYRGVYVDGSNDASRIENTHFIWQGGTLWTPTDPYCQWINWNGIAFEFGKSSFQTVSHTFSFAYSVGFKFSQTPSGACDGSFVACGADSAERAILVDQVQAPGVSFANTVFLGHWFGKSAMALVVNPEVRGRISIENCWFAGSVTKNIWMRAPEGVLSVQDSSFVGWDVNGEGLAVPCIQLDAGRSIINGNSFYYGAGWPAGKNHKQLLVGPGVKSVLFSGNTGESNFELENQAGNKALIKDNIATP